jgi:hypothetical protein
MQHQLHLITLYHYTPSALTQAPSLFMIGQNHDEAGGAQQRLEDAGRSISFNGGMQREPTAVIQNCRGFWV